MRHTVKILSLAAIAGAITLSTAQAGAQITDQQRSYELVAVNGQSLPLIVEEEEGCREEILNATLTLGDSGEYQLEVTEREVCGDAVESEETEEETGTYTVEGDTVRFSEDDEEDDADEEDEAEDDEEEDEEDEEVEVDDLAVGTLSAGGVSVRLEDGETVLTFN